LSQMTDPTKNVFDTQDIWPYWRKNKDNFFSFVNPNPRQWIFLPTKEILIPVSGSEIKAIHVSYLLHRWWHQVQAKKNVHTSHLFERVLNWPKEGRYELDVIKSSVPLPEWRNQLYLAQTWLVYLWCSWEEEQAFLANTWFHILICKESSYWVPSIRKERGSLTSSSIKRLVRVLHTR
jgi:hypothetical protein